MGDAGALLLLALLAGGAAVLRARARGEVRQARAELAAAREELGEQRARTERERGVAERERALARDLRELGDLKDLLLADRAAEIDERERLIAELKASNAELARFNYTVSHDLKNPLVTIKNFLGLAREDAAAGRLDQLQDDIARVAAAAEKMERLLEELLELSRVGRPRDSLEEVELGEVARAAVEQLAEPIAERGVGVEIAADLPTVLGDRKRLFDLVHNLVDNAVRYFGDQPSPSLEIGARGDEDSPIFFVRDNGVGIEEAYHEKVFGLFDRLDTGTDGTGLGLALAKRIVEVHGGRIWVESDGPGRGSTFCFTLSGNGGYSAASG